jgi:hypothetical protein
LEKLNLFVAGWPTVTRFFIAENGSPGGTFVNAPVEVEANASILNLTGWSN